MEKKSTLRLHDLKNVGKATLSYLHLLNIESVEQLASADPDQLYTRVEELTKKHYDPCLWDLFSAIIHEARTGQKSPWWEWTAIRKQKEAMEPLCIHRKKSTV